MIIDTHCHLFKEYYDDIDALINDLKDNNIYCIVNGCDYKTNMEAINLSNENINIFSAIGFHPTEMDKFDNKYLEFLNNQVNSIIAIGEIGLDYYWNKDNKNDQIELFNNQLKFAEDHNLPVIIHARESIQDVYNILSKYKLRGIIHAYSGSYEMALKFIDLGYKLGIGGVLTFKNSKLRDVISKVDIKDIVLETDSPYLTPTPYRGTKNSPCYLKYIIDEISKIKGISYDEVCNITTKTATELFDLNI